MHEYLALQFLCPSTNLEHLLRLRTVSVPVTLTLSLLDDMHPSFQAAAGSANASPRKATLTRTSSRYFNLLSPSKLSCTVATQTRHTILNTAHEAKERRSGKAQDGIIYEEDEENKKYLEKEGWSVKIEKESLKLKVIGGYW